MIRTLLTRRWLAWLAVALVWAVAATFLGRWQWHRFESRHEAQTRISRNYDATPVPLTQVLGTGATSLPVADQWRQVTLHGRYDTADQILIRNRPNADGDYGYEVVLPFRDDSGGTIFVDRGWVPNGVNAQTPGAVPAAPTGEVTVTGWLRPSEPDLHRAPITGQAESINVAELSHMTIRSAYNAYVRMRTERTASGTTPARPQALGEPDQGMSAWINFSYAFQWWFGALAGLAFVFLRARREHLDSIGKVRVPKPKKARLWDTEDE